MFNVTVCGSRLVAARGRRRQSQYKLSNIWGLVPGVPELRNNVIDLLEASLMERRAEEARMFRATAMFRLLVCCQRQLETLRPSIETPGRVAWRGRPFHFYPVRDLSLPRIPASISRKGERPEDPGAVSSLRAQSSSNWYSRSIDRASWRTFGSRIVVQVDILRLMLD